MAHTENESPPLEGGPPRAASWVSLGMVLFASAAAYLYVDQTQGEWLKRFSELGSVAKLPAPTIFVLQPWFPLLFALLAGAGVVKEFLVSDRKATLIANMALILVVAAMTAVYWKATAEPYRKISEMMQKK